MKNKNLSIAYVPVDTLVANPGNARTHSRHQVRQIAESIKEFGFVNPILIDRNQTIIAGHGRVEAAKLVGIERVPTVLLEDLTEEQVRLYLIADNGIAQKAGWNQEILAKELQILLNSGNIDVTLTGFEVPEIDLILQEANAKNDPDDAVIIDTAGPPITKSGDVWKAGKHRLLCGDSREEKSYRTLMGTRRAAVVFADPPFNIPIEGNVSGHGSTHHREFAAACGEMNETEFTEFLAASLELLARFSTNGAIHFVCMDWRHVGELLAAGKRAYDTLLNICVWAKQSGGLGSFYKSQHEFILVFRNGKQCHRNNIALGKYGRNRSNIWSYNNVSAFSHNDGEGADLIKVHPTIKPVALVADAILDCSARGDIVLDPFLGSGTTLVAAERVGRICYGLEIEPQYVDVAIRRWQRHTGDAAILASSGQTFDELTSQVEHE